MYEYSFFLDHELSACGLYFGAKWCPARLQFKNPSEPPFGSISRGHFFIIYLHLLLSNLLYFVLFIIPHWLIRIIGSWVGASIWQIIRSAIVNEKLCEFSG